jgi:DNA-binding GntR family transcriptional regulator
VLGRLRDMIVDGRLKPDERIPERVLCEILEISRTPLREALKVLAAEGLVELLPNRGARVRRLTEAEVRSLFEVMAALEHLAGELAAARVSDADLAEIEALHFRMYQHYMRQELAEYFALNQAIHERIVAAAGNDVLRATYLSLAGRIRRARYAANVRNRERWAEAMREHESLLDALRRRDGAALGRQLADHLRNKCEAVCSHLMDGDAAAL